jgi:hypothetical protein
MAHVAVTVVHRRHRVSCGRDGGRRLIVTIRERGHLMRQTACPRDERRQRRGLKQDPRGREQAEMPADEIHLRPDQLNQAAAFEAIGHRFPQLQSHNPYHLSAVIFPAKIAVSEIATGRMT